jgi:BMFP domain-containing protein YqiC
MTAFCARDGGKMLRAGNAGESPTPASFYARADGRETGMARGIIRASAPSILQRRHGIPILGAEKAILNRGPAMAQTSNRIFDEMARLMNDAAGVAGGVRREFDTVMRTQAERILRELDVVRRDEFEAVKEMARLAREENEALKARIEALEAAQRPPQDDPLTGAIPSSGTAHA